MRTLASAGLAVATVALLATGPAQGQWRKDNFLQADLPLATPADPEHLSLAEARQRLAPGTVLLSYSTGTTKTLLIALASAEVGPSGWKVVSLDVGAEELQKRIAAFDTLLANDRSDDAEISRQGRALYDLLMRPVDSLLAASQKILVSADGPLNHLAFAALVRGDEPLAEWRPTSCVLSAAAEKLATETPQGTVISPLLFNIYRDPPDPFRAGGRVTRPERIRGVPPRYPEEARRAHLQGKVIVEAIIDEHGDVTNTRVIKRLPKGLNKAARETVASWKFKPATQDGKPVKVYYTQPINFQLAKSTYTIDTVVLLGLLARDRAVAALPPDAEVLVQMKADLTAKRRTLDDAWRWAQGYQGDSRALILVVLGGEAWRQATSDAALDPQAKAGLVDLGEKAESLALESRADLAEAMAWKALLLKEKAKDPSRRAQKTELLEESSQLFQSAVAIYQQSHPPPAAGGP